jgi:ribonuclease-3
MHRSFASEHKISYDNQRLEFLGDSVLELILTEYLFEHYPQYREGELTKIRSSLACEKTLAGFARKLSLGSYLFVGKGELESNAKHRNSTIADLFEAVLGAIFLDCGMEYAKKLVIPLIEELDEAPHAVLSTVNPKGRLQELSQANWNETPRYTVLNVSGPSHNPRYFVEVRVREFTACASGKSRKDAETKVAAQLTSYLEESVLSNQKAD